MATAKTKKDAPVKPTEKNPAPYGYMQNSKTGRVFLGTKELFKQLKKGKLNLVKINKGLYDEGIANGGALEVEPDVDLDEDEI